MPTKKRILVVEDNETILKLILFILENEGFRVQSTSRGDEALHLAKETHPDLVLMDVMMSPVNGYEVCRTLKSERDTRDIPVVLLSAKGQKKEQEEGLNAGANAYMVKPFEPDELVEGLKKHLNSDSEGGAYGGKDTGSG